MTTTPKYGLNKPEGSDYAKIQLLNENADKLDVALDGLETGKEVLVKNAAEKSTPVDADSLVLVDSADSSKTKRLTWSRVKATLNTLYSAVGHFRTKSQISDFPTTMAPSAHASTHKTGGTDALTADDIGAEVAGAAATVQISLTSHAGDTVKHITSTERTTWNGKAAGGHTHGNLSNDGKIGTVPDLPIFTGTGGALATKTAAAARAALVALAAFSPVSITISATWTGTGPYTQDIAVSGVLAWDWRLRLHLAKITDDAARKLQEKALTCITWCETYDGGITLTCRDKLPDVAISAVLAGEV